MIWDLGCGVYGLGSGGETQAEHVAIPGVGHETWDWTRRGKKSGESVGSAVERWAGTGRRLHRREEGGGGGRGKVTL
jgi:hypothetical protein